MTDNQFDTIEKLCRTKDYRQLTISEKELVQSLTTEDEYNAMRSFYSTVKQKAVDTLEPNPDIKKRLNKTFLLRKKSVGVFLYRIPLYQSAAVALLFFFVGLAISYFRQTPSEIVYNTTEVIRYVDKPVKQIEYVTVYKMKTLAAKQSDKTDVEMIPANEENVNEKPFDFSDYSDATQISMVDINHVLSETDGVSIGSDTLLRKMLNEIY